MATSLQEQLRRLAVPQTKVLPELRQKVSIIFKPKEAATKDRRTIYDLGISGLRELETLNSTFNQFEGTLFNEATLSMERAVESAEVNDLLNLNINKFLQHLSPYFLLRPAHLCIEWLLRRFKINEYNSTALLNLALPYHETNTFVLVLKTIDIRESDEEWGWLYPIRKKGVPLPKSAICNRAATKKAFLKFLCKSILSAVRELGSSAYMLQTQINFYGTIILGSFENSKTLHQWQENIILPTIISSFKSSITDLLAATLVITLDFLSRYQLKVRACNSLLKHIVGVDDVKLRRNALLVITFIFKSQTSLQNEYDTEALYKLLQQSWLIDRLVGIVKENQEVHSLCTPLIKISVAAVRKEDGNSIICKKFIQEFLFQTALPDAYAQHMINAFLDAFEDVEVQKTPSADTDVIEIDSDDEMENQDYVSWYTNCLQTLETQYPNAFDAALKTALNTKYAGNKNRSKAINIAVGYRLKSFDKNTTNIYGTLYHHSGKIRLMGIKSLYRNLDNYKAHHQNYELLKICLGDRIVDESSDVVAEVLNLNTKNFIDILGYEKFVESLFIILHRSDLDPTQWQNITAMVLKHLLSSEVVNNYDPNLILLALMPILFHDNYNKAVAKNILMILRSPLSEKFLFLKEIVWESIDTTNSNNDTNLFQKRFLEVLNKSQHTPSISGMFKSVEAHHKGFFRSALDVSHFMLLIISSLKKDLNSSTALKILCDMFKYTQHYKITYMDDGKWHYFRKLPYIPLQLYADLIFTTTRCTYLHGLANWEQDSPDLQFIFHVLKFVTQEIFLSTDVTVRREWTKILKDICNDVFHEPQSFLNFFTNFFVYSEISFMPDYPLLRFKSVKLFTASCKNDTKLRGLNLVHILKICMGLKAPIAKLRAHTLQTLEQIKETVNNLPNNLGTFIDMLTARSNEINMDEEQFPLVLFIILNPREGKINKQLSKELLKDIIQLLNVDTYLKHTAFIAELLNALKHVTDVQILEVVLPLAFEALEHRTSDGTMTMLETSHQRVYLHIVKRFEAQIITDILARRPVAWQLFEKSFEFHNVHMVYNKKLHPLPSVLLQVLDNFVYDALPDEYKKKLISMLLATIIVTDNDAVFRSAKKFLNKCTLNGNLLQIILREMLGDLLTCEKSAQNLRPTAAAAVAKRQSEKLQIQVCTPAWKKGVVLLELLGGNKHLEKTEKLIPVLFDLLKVCLELEEQSSVEYAKQMVLTTLFECCMLCKQNGVELQKELPANTFRIDHIVEYVRSTQNPQTHHNALLLLAHCADLYPQQLLHNIVQIFTFVGSTVVRHDDTFSFYVINTIVETIVPILVANTKSNMLTVDGVESNVVPLMKVFSDIMLDVPEHRRFALYTKLLSTLGAEEYLWSFLCIVFEAHVVDSENEKTMNKKKSAQGSKVSSSSKLDEFKTTRFQIVLDIAKTFEPKIILKTCIKLLDYIATLPFNKENALAQIPQNSNSNATEVTLFDFKCHTSKQLRHYKYVIVEFLQNITHNKDVLLQVASLTDKEHREIKSYYQNFIIKILTYIPKVKTTISHCSDAQEMKFWKAILHHMHDLLENVILLLSPNLFLVVINGLVMHNICSIRRKVIELLIGKLIQKEPFFTESHTVLLHTLFKPFNDILDNIQYKNDKDSAASSTVNTQDEVVQMQQTTLIAIKLLSRSFAQSFTEEFKEILAKLTKILRFRKRMARLLISGVVLCITEISANLKAHSLAQLPKYMPQLIGVLNDQAKLLETQPPVNSCLAILLGILKLFESIPLFLGPYMVDVIVILSTLSTRIVARHIENESSNNALQKIDLIWTTMAKHIPARISVPLCEDAYKRLMKSKNYDDIKVLMNLLSKIISQASREDWNIETLLSELFKEAIEYRSLMKNTNCDVSLVKQTETAILDTYVAWVIKLSDSSFRPIYRKLYEWAFNTEIKEKYLTFFLLTQKITDALQSLFILFTGDFINNVAELLTNYNSGKNKEQQQPDEEFEAELLKAIFSILYNVFLHDSREFIKARRFTTLMAPIVDQTENTVVLQSDELQTALISCISQLGATVKDDMLLKQLHQHLMLKARISTPEIKMLTFNCCVELARKVGDDFMPLLPETVPFIAELLEDDNVRVEKCVRKCVHDLESIMGQSLQKYF